MEDIYEITIIGRGGQGAKTASEVLAIAALHEGKYIQAFSEYGAERSGAPIVSFIRISKNPITIHTSVLEPNLTVVMDESLLSMANKNSDKVVINTVRSPDKIKHCTNLKGKIYTADCTGISVEILGRNIPNTPTLGAVLKATNLLPKNCVEKQLRNKLEQKIGKKIMDKNIECFNRAYEELKEH
ncbi:MAG: Pyruvate/ketoisovalerate oxidoreductases common subunit gamma [Candidatus Woesearchaeota archaeon]|nr:Pyruvate/ketoisovalerate oxidoreductases common subunit gamma [Candidatus Woesearchaeota archaeon]